MIDRYDIHYNDLPDVENVPIKSFRDVPAGKVVFVPGDTKWQYDYRKEFDAFLLQMAHIYNHAIYSNYDVDEYLCPVLRGTLIIFRQPLKKQPLK